jgi:hypothetical protein
MARSPSPNRKTIGSLTMLISWKILNERNAYVFDNKQPPPIVIFEKIKKETKLWIPLDQNV